GDQRAERLEVGAIEDRPRRLSHRLPVEAEQSRRRAVDRGDGAAAVNRDDTGGDALEDRLDVAAPSFDLDVLSLELDRPAVDLAAAGRQLGRHRVERLDERPELVVALRLDALIETARAN